MDNETIFSDPKQVTAEIGEEVFTRLSSFGMCHFLVDEGRGPRRMVIATFTAGGTDAIMIAHEGSGCAFIKETDNLNPFVFIEGGLQFKAAHIVAAMFASMDRARARLVERNASRAHLQLEDKRS